MLWCIVWMPEKFFRALSSPPTVILRYPFLFLFETLHDGSGDEPPNFIQIASTLRENFSMLCMTLIRLALQSTDSGILKEYSVVSFERLQKFL